MKRFLLLIIVSLVMASCSTTPPPAAVGPVPSERQLAWHELEYYGFVHFNMNTFSNMEWGLGDEKPEQFNPTELDCRQWARECKKAGMKGIILTAKHHDGFCLWPSAYTEHSVKNSPWKDGKGDVLKELSKACKEYDLKFGVYLSPWDRNHAEYGTPEYITYFRNQLRELLTNYGEVFEVWFDGANGGTGYYGGANENRKVDKLTYYDWENTISIIRELQPNAVIFSDAGPDVRWVGNEHGFAYQTTWSTLLRDSVYGGMPEYHTQYADGQENGTHWVPAEADVSIRPGWYYHEYEDHKVKSLPRLLEIYYKSIGQNSSLLLNFPVDKRGLIHEKDVEQLQKLAAKVREDFADNVANGAKASATSERGRGFSASKVLDRKTKTYWATEDDVIQASLTVNFDQPTTFNRFLMQEFIALGQRVKTFSIEAQTIDGWTEIASETTIGYKRILRFDDVTATAVRLNIKDAKACPTIANIEIYRAPKLLMPPTIARNQAGDLSLSTLEDDVDIYYTIDGNTPSTASKKYAAPFVLHQPANIKAITADGARTSEISSAEFDVSAAKWKALHGDKKSMQVIDGKANTWWSDRSKKNRNEIVVDLGETLELKGFTYLPMQQRWISGFIKEYQFYVSTNKRNWKLASEGEFGNIENSPILQRITFPALSARYIKLKATTTIDGNAASCAEIGIVTR
jgi:alpha-L-fucosidase